MGQGGVKSEAGEKNKTGWISWVQGSGLCEKRVPRVQERKTAKSYSTGAACTAAEERGSVCNKMEARFCAAPHAALRLVCWRCAHAEPAEAAGAVSPAVSSLGASPAASFGSGASAASSSGRRFCRATVEMEHMSGNSGQLLTMATAFCGAQHMGAEGRG